MASFARSSTPTMHDDDDDRTVRHSNCTKDRVRVPPGFSGRPTGLPPSKIWTETGAPTIGRDTPPTNTGPCLVQAKPATTNSLTKNSRARCMNPWQAAWATISELKKRNEHTSDACFDVSGIKIGVDYAVADAGATGHFLVPGAPVINKAETTNPLSIHLPNGDKLTSTHTCELDVPSLPKGA